MELPVLGYQIFEESFAVLHLKIEFIILVVHCCFFFIGVVILKGLLKFVKLALLEFIILSVLLVFDDMLSLGHQLLELGKAYLFFYLCPVDHLVAVLQLMPQSVFLLKNACFKRIQIFLKEFVLDSF